MTEARQISHVRPHVALRVLGIALVAVGAASIIVAVLSEPRSVALIVALFCALPIAAGAWLGLVGARVSATPGEILVSYWPMTVRVPRSEIVEIVPGDDRTGLGFGYGYRWEGRGVRAIRLGGPMVTIRHARGRVSVSVNDPERVQHELGA